jgi:hypothetical protein
LTAAIVLTSSVLVVVLVLALARERRLRVALQRLLARLLSFLRGADNPRSLDHSPAAEARGHPWWFCTRFRCFDRIPSRGLAISSPVPRIVVEQLGAELGRAVGGDRLECVDPLPQRRFERADGPVAAEDRAVFGRMSRSRTPRRVPDRPAACDLCRR